MSKSTSQDIIDAHSKSATHRDAILKADRCGCFYCCAEFSPIEITEWIDPASDDMQAGTTALCPRCGIDSVIPMDSDMDAAFLKAMKKHWF